MRQPGVEDECFGFAKRIDHTVQEADKESRSRGSSSPMHRATRRGAQRPDLAAAPDQIDWRTAMRHTVMNGAAKVEPSAAAARLMAAHQPRSHDPRKPPGQRMSLGDIIRIDDVAHVRAGEIVDARSAFAPRVAVSVAAPSPPSRRCT